MTDNVIVVEAGSTSVYIDRAGHAHDVGALGPVLRLEVEQALALAHVYRLTVEVDAARQRIDVLEAEVDRLRSI